MSSSSSSWNSWFQSQKEAVTNALDKTGDVLSKAATSAAVAGKNKAREANSNEQHLQQQTAEPITSSSSSVSANANSNNNNNNIFSSITHMIDQTRVAIEQEQSKLLTSITAFTNTNTTPTSLLHQRPLHWPLDVDALRDMEVVYITDRIITCSHPYLDSAVDPTITAERKLQALSHLLHQRHDPNKYMIWNLSEVNNYSAASLSHFNDQVLTFSFPGSPSPPMGLLLKLVVSMESWLQAEPDNVIVVHCLTGRGRSSLAVAALLCWTGEAQFTTSVPMALDYIAQCKQIHPNKQHQSSNENETNKGSSSADTNTGSNEEDELTIPSQRRYGAYFTNMMEGIRPFQPPLVLKRIILSQAPKFCRGPRPTAATASSPDKVPNEDDPSEAADDANPSNSTSNPRMGCAPYLQIFKGGQLIFTTTPAIHSTQQQVPQGQPAQQQQQNQSLPFCSVADGPISFMIDIIVQGDVLIRCRHVTPNKSRVSMFRAAFHTGYVPTPILRLKKSELDGACHDRRFGEDFYVDVIFEPVQAETASQHLMSSQGDDTNDNNNNEEDVDDGTTEQDGTAKDETKTDSKAEKQSGQAASIPMESRNEARERRDRATLAGFAAAATAGKKRGGGSHGSTTATVTATAYDSMLHRDSRFWEVIAAKREKRQERQSSSPDDAETTTQSSSAKEQQERDLKFWGPTIGRRRDFSRPNQRANAASADGSVTTSNALTSADTDAFLSTPFSIGGEFDFLPSTSPVRSMAESSSIREEPKVDSLMDALNALEDDDDTLLISPRSSMEAAASHDRDQEDMEEIVFETQSSSAKSDSTPAILITGNESAINSSASAAPSAKEDIDGLLNDDTDVDALLAVDDSEGDGNIDLDGLEDDDELEELETFLSQK